MKHVEMIVDYVAVGDDYQYCDNHGLLIRCRDCRFYSIEDYGICTLYPGMSTDKNFYCANAEKGVGDDSGVLRYV